MASINYKNNTITNKNKNKKNNINNINNKIVNNNNNGKIDKNKNDKNDTINNFNINQQFYAAVAENNIDKMKKWLKVGANVNVRNENDQAATQLALLNDNYEMLRILIENYGADVNSKNNNNGINLITLACVLDNVQVLKLLIDNGANPDCSDLEKQTPLHHCVQFDSQAACKYLLDAGANVNVKGGPNMDSLLHYACFESNLEIIKLLCSRNDIDLNAKNALGQTAFYIICTTSANIKIINFLIEHRVDINLKDSKNISPIGAACEHKHYHIVKRLLTVPNLLIDVSNPFILKYFKETSPIVIV